MISFLPSGRIPSTTRTGRRNAPLPDFRDRMTPSNCSTRYGFLNGRRWKARTASSST